MTDREVKKLNRTDLLKLLIEQTEENERLAARLSKLEQQLADRTIALENSGSIAEAALRLSGVFDQAQDAADSYLESIRAKQTQIDTLLAQAQRRQEQTEADCARQEEQTRQKCRRMEERTRQLCAKLLAEAKASAPEAPAAPDPAPAMPAGFASRFRRRSGQE